MYTNQIRNAVFMCSIQCTKTNFIHVRKKQINVLAIVYFLYYPNPASLMRISQLIQQNNITTNTHKPLIIFIMVGPRT